MHLRYSYLKAFDCEVTGHAQKVINALGITYQYATPQSIADQFWFWNCENVPSELPEYLSVLDVDPMDCIGYGLDEEEAKKIRDYRSKEVSHGKGK